MLKDDFELSDDGKTLVRCLNKEIRTACIPKSIIVIGSSAFFNCEKLEQVQLPPNLEIIESFAFFGCDIKSISFPAKVKRIDEDAFSACLSLDSFKIELSIKDKVKDLYYNIAYKICRFIKDETLKNKIVKAKDKYWNSKIKIHDEAFVACLFDERKMLQYLWIDGYPWGGLFNKSIDNVLYYDNALIAYRSNKKLFFIPNWVNCIGYCAFSYNNTIEEIQIPQSVCKIDDRAFEGCKNLKKIRIDIREPQNVEVYIESFDNMHYKNVTLVVPLGLANLYKSLFVFDCFENIIEE